MKKNIKHFIEIGQYGLNDANKLVDCALELKKNSGIPSGINTSLELGSSSMIKGESIEDTMKVMKLITGTDACVVSMFHQPSTRTALSFQMAIKKLGYNEIITINDIYLKEISPKAVVIRHAGGNEKIFSYVPPDIPIINAGSGTESHPTQALADLMTIKEHFGKIKGVKVHFAGNIKYSRVAKSFIKWFEHMGGIIVDNTVGLPGTDIAYVLRTQTEWGETTRPRDIKTDKMIMHAGPVTVKLDGDTTLVDQQVINGVYARMVALKYAMGYLG